MEKTVLERYCRHPLFSLQEMSSLRIATTLCSNRKLFQLIIINCKLTNYRDERLFTTKGAGWVAVQSMAKKLLSKISTCTKINNRIMELVWPTCYRIMVWRSRYAPFIEDQFLFNFYWTDQARINTIRTARFIVKNENISVRNRFIVACSVCLDAEIREMWQDMSNNDRRYVHAESRKGMQTLLLFWLNTLEGTGDLEQLIDDAIAYAFWKGLLVAMKYLFSIVTENKRRTIAYNYARNFDAKINKSGFLEEEEIDMGYFLFLETSKIYRNEISALPTLQLTLLLYFAEREIFMDALKKILQSASLQVINILLNMMFMNFHLEVISDDYGTIFTDIWKMIPVSMKSGIADLGIGGIYLSHLIRDNFPFVLKPVGRKKIAKLNSLDSNFGTSVSSFHRGKWEFLKFLIEEEVATIPSLKSMKQSIINNLNIRTTKASWKRLLEFVQQVRSKSMQSDK